MSILSAQCERLRSLANNLRQTSRGHKEYISAMRDAADTIWKLRNTNLDTANENDDLKAENRQLRELVYDMWGLIDRGGLTTGAWGPCQEFLVRMKALGIEAKCEYE